MQFKRHLVDRFFRGCNYVAMSDKYLTAKTAYRSKRAGEPVLAGKPEAADDTERKQKEY